MPFLGLGVTCVDHGQASTSPSDVCCAGLQQWGYDANTGVPYSGFMCWSATCASAGQWAGPNGVGNSCCAPLVNVGGKCGTQSSGGGGSGGGSTCATIGKVPLAGQACCSGLSLDSTGICNIPPQSNSLIPGVDNMVLYAGAGLMLLLMFMGKKKGA